MPTLVFHRQSNHPKIRKFRPIFFLLLFTGISLQGFALNKKAKTGINDGIGTSTGNGNEVKLPIGLPFQITSPSMGVNEDGGVPIDQPSKIVYTFDLPDGQGPESVHETHSAFAQARSMNAACVLIRMNSMSSALNAAKNLSNEISDYDRPVMVYVNDRAISANTLISMAAENKKNSSSGKSSRQNQKNQKNHSQTQTTNSFPNSSNAMDDNSCISNLSNAQQNRNQFTTGQNGDLDDVLVQAGLNNYTVVHYSPGFFAQVLDWCMKPYMSLILILLVAFGIRTQIKSAFPGPATFLLMVSLPLFAIPLFVGGLAGAAEFGFVIFLTIALLISIRKKSSSKIIPLGLVILLLVALTLCQSENLSMIANWKIPMVTFLLTSASFIAGWFIPAFFGKSLQTNIVSISSAS